MKVYPAGLLCLEKTNYFLTLTRLSFSISLNDSLTDFLMFIFSMSTWSWQPSEIQRGATFPKDWELETDMVAHCERAWTRGNNLPEKNFASCIQTHTSGKDHQMQPFHLPVQSKAWHPDDKHREMLRTWNTEIETEIKNKLSVKELNNFKIFFFFFQVIIAFLLAWRAESIPTSPCGRWWVLGRWKQMC